MSQLICCSCGKRYGADNARWLCECGGLLDLDFQPSLDMGALTSRPPTLWRYREAIPVPDGADLTLGEGFTPMLPVPIGGREMLVKQEQLFPTGSYKDRGAAVMVAMARHLGVESVVEDSSGNAGCAVAAYCARAGIECRIFVPADNSPAKLGQIELYGARLEPVEGSREDTAEACMNAAEAAFYASHVYNPYFFHGTKTFAYEVVEQLGWRGPDTVVLPAGNGTLLLGAYIGFKELLSLGLVERLPRIVAVQSAGCAPLHASFHAGRSDPTAIEPTSAAVVAGAAAYGRTAAPDETIVTVFTGHGLKVGSKLHSLMG